ncbi:MAG TPA: hypothetical protein IAB02_03755 [Candidatus Pullichristensenella excrementigallinarum]|uniref:Uncharacterized protein n=1 Tax=Candidatus Pullichristensenella excrementigallinarum TaxID=2840907 RepID=A0A9D1LCG6_9FIRM|nr:hypothetical protein [Candidatus Pullichristensenella excrementigallinarum]
MYLSLNAGQCARLVAYCEHSEDCERISQNELILDLYGLSRPMTLDLVIETNGVRVDGAFFLGYDEEMDGYFLTDPVENPADVLRALQEAGALDA